MRRSKVSVATLSRSINLVLTVDPQLFGSLEDIFASVEAPNCVDVDPTKDMHEGSFTFIDDDHLETNRQAYQYGKPTDVHTVHMKLVRKK